jgi:hypothetical protein
VTKARRRGNILDQCFSKILESGKVNANIVFQKIRKGYSQKIYGFLTLLENHMYQRGHPGLMVTVDSSDFWQISVEFPRELGLFATVIYCHSMETLSFLCNKAILHW